MKKKAEIKEISEIEGIKDSAINFLENSKNTIQNFDLYEFIKQD